MVILELYWKSFGRHGNQSTLCLPAARRLAVIGSRLLFSLTNVSQYIKITFITGPNNRGMAQSSIPMTAEWGKKTSKVLPKLPFGINDQVCDYSNIVVF